MLSWQFLVALTATAISIPALTHLAKKNYKHNQPATLSELAAQDDASLKYFRSILWLCGSLFAVALYPSLGHFNNSAFVAIGSTLMIGAEMLLAWLPARGKTVRIHNILAVVMAIGMLILACVFIAELSAAYKICAIIIALAMSTLTLLTILDRKRFIYYELPFIFLSHLSIVVALFAVTG